MPSVFVVKGKIDAPMEWYAKVMDCDSEWKYDDMLKSYHLGNVYLTENADSVSFEDMSEDEFFGWETTEWIALAENKEVIYGYYNEGDGNAEFVHIRNGKCIRDFREYDFEIDTDEGTSPSFDDWTDVAEYVDNNLL